MGALEQIADSRRQKIVAAQESETRRFAGKIADEIIGKTGLADRDNELKETISGLASAIGEAVVASGEQYQLAIGDHFSQLIETLSVEPDLTSLETLADRIDAGLRELKQELARLELKPEINLEAPDYKPLLSRLDSLVAKIPNRIEASIDVDYRPAPATDYLNVRLTDGFNFYRAGGGGGGGGSSPTVDTGDGVFAVPVANPDGTPLSLGSTSVDTATSAGVTVADTSTTVLAVNANRKSATIVNDSDETIYLKLGSGASLNSGIRINANGGSAKITEYTGIITAISTSGGKVVTVTEL